MIPCVIIKLNTEFNDIDIKTVDYTNHNKLIEMIEYEMRDFFREVMSTNKNKRYNTIDDLYERYWNEPYKTDCPFIIKYYYENKWNSVTDTNIQGIWNGFVESENIEEKLNNLYENESKWIRIVKNKKLKSKIDQEAMNVYNLIDNIEIKIFTNDAEEFPENITEFEYNEAYYIKFTYKNDYYYLIIDANFNVIASHYEGIIKSTCEHYRINTNFENYYSYIKSIGYIIHCYFEHILTKELTQYKFDFNKLDHKYIKNEID
jgi:hypothetical protein